MRITESTLRKIVREELSKLDDEYTDYDPEEVGEFGPRDADPHMGRTPDQYASDSLQRDAGFPGAEDHAIDALVDEFGMADDEAAAVVQAVMRALGR